MMFFTLIHLKLFFISIFFGFLYYIFYFINSLFLSKYCKNLSKNLFFVINSVFFSIFFLIFINFYNFGSINIILIVIYSASFLYCKKTFNNLLAKVYKKLYNIKKYERTKPHNNVFVKVVKNERKSNKIKN